MTRKFSAPAKINLCLHVLGKREDGYHDLAMAMQQVDLCDEMTITTGSGQDVRVRCDGVELDAGEENIAARAARVFLAETGLDAGVEIDIVKHIPVAAGLGGGSSNAATVLAGLNEMLGGELDREQLMQLGATLGADVPFFLYGPTAWATGTGTDLEPLPDLPEVCYLLVNPKIAVSTAWVYRSLRLTTNSELANLSRFSVRTVAELVASLHNDLEPVTAGRHSEITLIKNKLVENGALGALMSGSGATVFGLFDSLAAATAAGDRLRTEFDWKTFPVRPL